MTFKATLRRTGIAIAAALGLLAVYLSPCPRAAAQSLDPKQPAPLQEGANDGTVDNFVGPNYFYLWVGPGKTTITVSFKSMGLMGNPMRSELTVELTDIPRTWIYRTTISSLKDASLKPMVGNYKKETKVLVAIIPPGGGLIRSGGDYEVTVTGPARYGKPLTDAELIAGMYTPNAHYGDEDTAVKFLPDGTLAFASGTTGTWKLFDAASHLYTVTFGNVRLSLKLIPGRGLVLATDPTSIVFQRSR